MRPVDRRKKSADFNRSIFRAGYCGYDGLQCNTTILRKLEPFLKETRAQKVEEKIT